MRTANQARTGLFFGSFNPVHIGHLIIGEYMVRFGGLDEVWYIVSPQNPFKEKAGLLDESHRLEMVRLALGDHPHLKASDIEFNMPRPSYTIDTLRELEAKYPERTWVLLMGSDTAATLPDWKDFETVVSGYEIYVYARPGNEFSRPDWGKRMTIFPDVPLMYISASFIRKAISEGKPMRYLLPDEVRAYILQNSLYSLAG